MSAEDGTVPTGSVQSVALAATAEARPPARCCSDPRFRAYSSALDGKLHETSGRPEAGLLCGKPARNNVVGNTESSTMTDRQPNIALVVLDTLRYDHFDRYFNLATRQALYVGLLDG